MIEIANWQAPQWIMAGIAALSLVFSFMRHGRPKIKEVNEDGVEVNGDAGNAIFRWALIVALLAWGGFFA